MLPDGFRGFDRNECQPGHTQVFNDFFGTVPIFPRYREELT